MKTILLLFALAAGVIGCTEYAVRYGKIAGDLALIGTSIDEIRASYSTVKRMVEHRKEIFTADEIDALENLDTVVDIILAKLDAIKRLDSEATLNDMRFLYSLTKEAYIEARAIVAGHIDDFDQGDMIMLKSFDQQVVDIGSQIDELLASPGAGTAERVLSLVVAGLKVGFKIVSLIV